MQENNQRKHTRDTKICLRCSAKLMSLGAKSRRLHLYEEFFFTIRVTRDRRYIFIPRLHVQLGPVFYTIPRLYVRLGPIVCTAFWTQPLSFTLSYVSHTQHDIHKCTGESHPVIFYSFLSQRCPFYLETYRKYTNSIRPLLKENTFQHFRYADHHQFANFTILWSTLWSAIRHLYHFIINKNGTESFSFQTHLLEPLQEMSTIR